MDDPSNSNSDSARRGRSSNFRRLLLIFYTLLAIFTFAYWEEIQIFWHGSSSAGDSSSSASSLSTSENKIVTSSLNFINGTTSAAVQLSSSTSSCFTNTTTPWHISIDEKLTCTNNGEFPPSFQDDLFFSSCEKCCQMMFRKQAIHCHCEDVCGHAREDGTGNNSGNATVEGGETKTSSSFSFCSTCIFTGNTSCKDRVDYLLEHLPDSIPTEKVAQQNLLKVGHCIALGDAKTTDPAQQQEEGEQSTGRCTFCEEGVHHPDYVVPKTSGNTCKQIQAMIDEKDLKNGTEQCQILQEKERECCGDGWHGATVKVDFQKQFDVIMPMRNMRYENGTFIGASEWYRYWTEAKNIRNKNSKDTDYSQMTVDHSHDDYVLSLAQADSEKAIEHVTKMKSRYEEVNAIPDYRVRGLGWIEQRLGMVLTVVVAGDKSGDGEESVFPAGNVSVFIVDTVGDIKCGGYDNNSDELPDNWMDYHPPLTMWVRANGPEIFAGTALPHVFASSTSPDDRHRCAWRFDFEPQTPGEYSIYVKALTFNGFADWNKGLCKTESLQWQNKSTEFVDDTQIQAAIVQKLAKKGNFSYHRGLMAFKNYDKLNSCCEACTRTRGCRMWSIPGEIDECELYFDRIEDDLDFWDSDLGKHLGRDRAYSYVRQNVAEFPIWRRRRLDRNDRRELAMNRGEVNLPKWPNLNVPDSYGYPREEPAKEFIGCGWSNLKSFESPCHYPSDDLIFGSGKRIEITVDSDVQIENASIASKVEGKRACSLEDESFGNGRWVKYPFPDDSVCMPVEIDLEGGGFSNYMPKYNATMAPPFCWHRDVIDQCCNSCAEAGCRFIVNHRWVTDLRQAGKWFGRWENYDCSYDDMGIAEIQQCIDRKNISEILVEGASVKEMLKRYMGQKLKGVQLVNQTSTTRKVILDTLKMPHVVWHDSVKEFGMKLDEYKQVDDESLEYYFVTGFYFSSEREPHVVADRSLQFSNVAREKLIPKGYKMINAFDVTAAFTYDSDAQNDGLHITGPPIRAILTKFFHHLCHE